MLIEGYKPDRLREVRERARQLMKQHHVEGSIPRK